MDTHLWRWEGEVTVDWLQLCRIEPSSPSEHQIFWNNDVLAQFDIDKRKIVDGFEKMSADSPKGK